MADVLIVDDEPSICWGFEQFLSDDGHNVRVASSAEEALRLVEQSTPAAIVLDVRLPGMDGLTAIEQIRQRIGDVPIIVITAFGNLETAVRAVREGAFDYLPKPFDLDRAAELVNRALAVTAAKTKSTQTPAIDIDTAHPGGLVGASPAMQQVFKQIALAATSDVPVLITGESGTGKELVARAIHDHSPRADGPFVPVCLAALNEGVVESELFGHASGAFTGATHERRGLLELADAGTVLLDEIADCSPAMQVKLLRALEQREITPVGSVQPRRITGRILAATNRSLTERMADGRFREDLFYRLSVFEIALPALRDRADDVLLLAEHFLATTATQNSGSSQPRLSPAAARELQQRPWWGNVRELRNTIEHAVLVSRGGTVEPEHLPQPLTRPPAVLEAKNDDTEPSNENAGNAAQAAVRAWAQAALQQADIDEMPALYEQFLEAFEPILLEETLAVTAQNRAAAADRLGIHRGTLRQKLRRHGLAE